MNRLYTVCAALVLASVALCVGTVAHAQSEWPNKPIRVIVPSPPGGVYEKIFRPISLDLAATLKQPVVLDFRPGAGNIIGITATAQAAPDGYTFGMTGMINTITSHMYNNVPFDLNRDFVHVGSLGEGPQWLVVRADLGIDTLAQLLEAARKSPGMLNYATSGAGSTGHLVMEQLQRVTKTTLTHVPYKGGAPALVDVLAGVVAITVIPPAGALPHVKSGKLKALAVSSDKRMPAHPGIPSFAELGYPALTAVAYAGLSAPKGTPPEIINRFYAALKVTLDKPAIRAQIEADGAFASFHGPEAYANLLKSDSERWGKLIRELDLKAQ